MQNTISSFESFKKFSSVRTDVYGEAAKDDKKAVIPGTQMFIQGSKYNFKETAGNTTAIDGELPQKSRIMNNNFLTKAGVEYKKLKKLPEYVYRGLKGDPNANFYEYLSIAKIPYLMGGPMLAAVFAFGITRHDTQARASAIKKVKQIAVGIGLYYLGVELAKKAIDIPVRIFRGIDLNHPYENVVDLRAVSKTGYSPKRKEFHKVPESVDFTRWDLMYGDETEKNGKNINKRFDELTGKFGIDKNLQDSDSTLKGLIKKLIVSATASKYMLMAPFVVLGTAISSHDSWGNIGTGLRKNIAAMFSTKSNIDLGARLSLAKNIANENLITPMKESLKYLWGKKGAPNKLGRAIILTSAIAPVLANLRILSLSSAKSLKFVDVTEYVKGHKKDKNA